MIGVVLLNYNTWDDTLQCMESVLSGDMSDAIQIYLVDNHSSAKRPERVTEFCTEHRVVYIQNRENIGYAAGNNVGVKQALADGCDAVLISNSDVRYKKDSIRILYQYLITHPEAGIVGPKIKRSDGSTQKECMAMKTGIREKFLLRTRLKILFPEYNRRYWARQHDYEHEIFDVYAVLGCCFMMSRNCAEHITPFDEGTFLYEEELIIGIQMEQAGFKTVYNPESVILHFHEKSTGGVKENPEAYTYQVCSEIYYCRKYLHIKKMEMYLLWLYRTLLYIGRMRKTKFRRYWKTYQIMSQGQMKMS